MDKLAKEKIEALEKVESILKKNKLLSPKIKEQIEQFEQNIIENSIESITQV